MSLVDSNCNFRNEVQHLRATYERKRNSTNLYPPVGRPVYGIEVRAVDDIDQHTFWYELEDSKNLQCIRLYDIPGTLSGDILRLNKQLPTMSNEKNYEIQGDKIVPLETVPTPRRFESDAENLTSELCKLPEIAVDPDKHFVKQGKYRSEIRNLLTCQGGSCPGVPISPHIIQLLGKSADGHLVFEKQNPRYILAFVHDFCRYRSWILQIITGLAALHSVGIVHRDLRIDNLVFSTDATRVWIIDLEGRWGNWRAPEVSDGAGLDAGWTEMSDIYDLGSLIKDMIYGNVPLTLQVDWDAPTLLKPVVEACTRDSPSDRPSLSRLHDMVTGIAA
ncbi:kinase-like protein [Pseudovirgaria hyperparasitica]|uniref:EKC/KEOPS complex subunit BUD32 n=1 Tax=Pseudovirgaria hyperparasitica TaxID=470096 RepID=A0A6A6WCS0_9PEZI|nr:kinase-like protein [Pseudovirgaria hyperparasitica]KAF2758901.1 kinase-like protein [Pseudovirgaria hyperparasitica]